MLRADAVSGKQQQGERDRQQSYPHKQAAHSLVASANHRAVQADTSSPTGYFRRIEILGCIANLDNWALRLGRIKRPGISTKEIGRCCPGKYNQDVVAEENLAPATKRSGHQYRISPEYNHIPKPCAD